QGRRQSAPPVVEHGSPPLECRRSPAAGRHAAPAPACCSRRLRGSGGQPGEVLLAGLRGAEPHRVRDLCPGESCAPGEEQQTRLHAVDLRTSGRQQGECRTQVLLVELTGAPERVLGEIHSGRWYRWRAPRARLELVRTAIEETLDGGLLLPRPLLVCAGVGFLLLLAFHAATLQNQRTVVNI